MTYGGWGVSLGLLCSYIYKTMAAAMAASTSEIDIARRKKNEKNNSNENTGPNNGRLSSTLQSTVAQ